jgi:hypothetical protein
LTTNFVDLLLAVTLFYVVNWIGGHSSGYGYLQLSLFVRSDQAPAFNFILKTFTPSVFIILVSTAFYTLHLDRLASRMWLVAVYYFAYRLIYNLILGRALLLNWLSMSLQWVIGISAAYLVYVKLILPRRPLFPDLSSVGNQLWVVVALFLYAALNTVRVGTEASARRKNTYLRSRLKSLRSKYGDQIKDQFPRRYMELVAYAILIEETFNRPWVAQKLERAVFPWGSQTIGPMQVRSSTQLSDNESVRLGVKLLRLHFETTLQELSGRQATQFEVIRRTLAKYNRDNKYISEVADLLHVLWAQIAPEYRTDFEDMYFKGVVGAPIK